QRSCSTAADRPLRLAAHAGPTTPTFSYTGAVQTWAVPTGVTAIDVDVRGAQGSGNYGGLGRSTFATMAPARRRNLRAAAGPQASASSEYDLTAATALRDTRTWRATRCSNVPASRARLRGRGSRRAA